MPFFKELDNLRRKLLEVNKDLQLLLQLRVVRFTALKIEVEVWVLLVRELDRQYLLSNLVGRCMQLYLDFKWSAHVFSVYVFDPYMHSCLIECFSILKWSLWFAGLCASNIPSSHHLRGKWVSSGWLRSDKIIWSLWCLIVVWPVWRHHWLVSRVAVEGLRCLVMQWLLMSHFWMTESIRCGHCRSMYGLGFRLSSKLGLWRQGLVMRNLPLTKLIDWLVHYVVVLVQWLLLH